MYLVTDDYGTRQRCWSWSQAVSWLQAASPNAHVYRFGRLVAGRTQGD